MGIDVSRFKIVYKNKVYNALEMQPTYEGEYISETNMVKPDKLDVIVINEDGTVVCINDSCDEFQFIPII